MSRSPAPSQPCACLLGIDPLLDQMRARRSAVGLTKSSLAAQAGTSDSTLRHMDTARWNPTAATLRTLLMALAAEEARLSEQQDAGSRDDEQAGHVVSPSSTEIGPGTTPVTP